MSFSSIALCDSPTYQVAPSAHRQPAQSCIPKTQIVTRTTILTLAGIDTSILLWKPEDGLRKFTIKTHMLTTEALPGKSSRPHRLELMLSNTSSAGAADAIV
jgi:hypothetical protein